MCDLTDISMYDGIRRTITKKTLLLVESVLSYIAIIHFIIISF